MCSGQRVPRSPLISLNFFVGPKHRDYFCHHGCRAEPGAALSSLKEAQKKIEELLAYVRIVELNESIALAGGKI